MTSPSYPPTWHAHDFRAMGTQMYFWLETENEEDAQHAFTEAENLFHHHEVILSRFLEDSELCFLNRNTGRWTSVSRSLWPVLLVALDMAAETNGYFDPTLLNSLEQAGYTQSFEHLPGELPWPYPPLYPVMAANWRDILLDESDRSVFLPAGTRLDFGGIAKGFTAELAKMLLSQWGPCLVDAGGDISAGVAPAGFDGWPVAVSSPRNHPDQMDLFVLPLVNAGLATSGIDYRHWQQNGIRQHHLIHPVTKQPAETDLLTATIWAETATRAEAWATATIIAGTAGLPLLQEQALPAALITQNQELWLTPDMARLADLDDAVYFRSNSTTRVTLLPTLPEFRSK